MLIEALLLYVFMLVPDGESGVTKFVLIILRIVVILILYTYLCIICTLVAGKRRYKIAFPTVSVQPA